MEYKRFGNKIVLRLDPKDEICESLKTLALKENIKLASVTGLGAMNEFTAGIYSIEEKRFVSKDYKGAYEIASLVGNINTMNGEYYGHFHIAAGDGSGYVFGGHLARGVISLTAEIFVDVIDGTVDRVHDEEIGLNRFSF